jgi:predicted 3-demethylubiquinone-9 3-methyltransferase (glyoxalase superfamily)
VLVEFELNGQPFQALDGGPMFKFNEAISLAIDCADQAEVDYYWDKLTEGGEESQCGWLKDKYGLSWQVAPAGMIEILNDPDPTRGERAMKAMLGMKKLDVAALYAAALMYRLHSATPTSLFEGLMAAAVSGEKKARQLKVAR